MDRGQSADYLVDALVAIEAADNQTGRTIGDAEQGETPSVRRTGTKPRQVDAAGDRGRRRGDSMLANQLGSVGRRRGDARRPVIHASEIPPQQRGER